MPPKEKPLTAEQVALLRTWIMQGAPWGNYWAFEPVKPQAPPAVKDTAWVRSPIDAFILAGLEQRGLKPAPPADKLTMVRRVYYDLTGLPPAPADVDAFVADDSPDALAKLVDHLLESPHYGEQWARHWLDVVRYAETNSYERDGAKPHAWKFRDYVIRSFNADKPYDRFVREQIAGDEIADPTSDALIASGYYRLGVFDDEPADPSQFRFDQLDDLVTTTSQGFLALTVNCARCHDHKIDPITQRDYYRLGAFFWGLRPNASTGGNIEVPYFASPDGITEYQAKNKELENERERVTFEIKKFESQLIVLYRNEHAAEGAAAAPLHHDIDELEYRFYRDTWDQLPDFASLRPEMKGTLASGLFDLRPATRDTAIGFVFEGRLIVPEDGAYTFYLDSDDGSRLRVDNVVVLEYDGIHGTGDPRQATVALKKGRLPITLEFFQREHGIGLNVEWSGPGIERRALSVQEKRGADGKPLTDGKSPREIPNFDTLLAKEGERLVGKAEVARYHDLRKKMDELRAYKVPGEYALAATENGGAVPEMFVLERGNPSSPGAKVEPGFPGVLGGGAPEPPSGIDLGKTSGRRSQLAHWLASPDNKLTSRVMVNRIWQHHFGRGIVRSSNNFGNLGTPPTHPELLDWLAGEFVRSGWKIKTMHRAIMLSSAYQMASTVSPEAQAADPANELFSHFDPRRLSAEELRDSVLAVNGQINLAMYGPSVYPQLSEEVLATQSQPGNGWGKATPEQEARRSIYIHVKRSLVVPLLASFDFPETDTSCEGRFVTTQPGQALAMLNGKFLNEAAAVFAKRLSKEAGDDATARVTLALRLAMCRPPQSAEIERSLKLIDTLQSKYGLTPEAAWSRFCLTLLNRNEFVYLD